jgi:hypothetical protein
MRTSAVFLLGVSIFLLLISWFFLKRHRTLAKNAIGTPIYIHPLTKAVSKDEASDATVSSERFLHLGHVFFFLALCTFLGAITYSSNVPLIWIGNFVSKVISLGFIFGFLGFCVTFLLVASVVAIAYDSYNRIAGVEPELRIKRKRYCSVCQNSFSKYSINATNFLDDVELASYHSGKLQCSVNTELCSQCSFPLSRETLNLRLSHIFRDKSVQCPKCKNCTFTLIKVSDPVRADHFGEAGHKDFRGQCYYCGYQVQRQPRITLSALESVIKSAIDRQYGYEVYGSRLEREIERMIRCDLSGKDRFKERYDLVDATYFPGDGTSSLREIKYLSTDDLRQVIGFIHQYVQERRDYEADPRNSNYGPD